MQRSCARGRKFHELPFPKAALTKFFKGTQPDVLLNVLNINIENQGDGVHFKLEARKIKVSMINVMILGETIIPDKIYQQ